MHVILIVTIVLLYSLQTLFCTFFNRKYKGKEELSSLRDKFSEMKARWENEKARKETERSPRGDPRKEQFYENLFKEYYKTMKLVFGKEFEEDARAYYDKYLEENGGI